MTMTRTEYLKFIEKLNFTVYYARLHRNIGHFLADMKRMMPIDLMPFYFSVVVFGSVADGEIVEIVTLDGANTVVIFEKGKKEMSLAGSFFKELNADSKTKFET